MNYHFSQQSLNLHFKLMLLFPLCCSRSKRLLALSRGVDELSPVPVLISLEKPGRKSCVLKQGSRDLSQSLPCPSTLATQLVSAKQYLLPKKKHSKVLVKIVMCYQRPVQKQGQGTTRSVQLCIQIVQCSLSFTFLKQQLFSCSTDDACSAPNTSSVSQTDVESCLCWLHPLCTTFMTFLAFYCYIFGYHST